MMGKASHFRPHSVHTAPALLQAEPPIATGGPPSRARELVFYPVNAPQPPLPAAVLPAPATPHSPGSPRRPVSPPHLPASTDPQTTPCHCSPARFSSAGMEWPCSVTCFTACILNSSV